MKPALKTMAFRLANLRVAETNNSSVPSIRSHINAPCFSQIIALVRYTYLLFYSPRFQIHLQFAESFFHIGWNTVLVTASSRAGVFKDSDPEIFIRGKETYQANLNPTNPAGTL